MIDFLLRRPVGVFTTFVGLIVLGALAFYHLPVSLMPDITIPEITVRMSYKSATARQIENLITVPVREHLLKLDNLEDVHSSSSDGEATIHLRFKHGSNIDYAFIEAGEKLDQLLPILPKGMDRPQVIKGDATDIPVFYLTVRFIDSSYSENRFFELSDFVTNLVRRRLEQLPEISMVDIAGTIEPQLRIEVDVEHVKVLGLTNDDIAKALSNHNVDPNVITVRERQYQYSINLTSILQTKEDIENIPLEIHGRVVPLKDLAFVSMAAETSSGVFLSDDRQALTMAIIKKADARMSTMVANVSSTMEKFKTEYPFIHYRIDQDQTTLLNYSIDSLKWNLIQSIVIVSLLVFVFLKDVVSPVLITLTLMVSMILSFLFFYITGLSINIISLCGLILANGNMIDNSIVVTDNILQLRRDGLPVYDACRAGTQEIMVPMFTSMLTNISIFVPLLFLNDIAGAIFFDEAISVTIGLIVSYFVSITLMPVLFHSVGAFDLSFERTACSPGFKKAFHSLLKGRNFYPRKIATLREKKNIILISAAAITVAGCAALFYMPRTKLPPLSQQETILTISWNKEINVPENRKLVSIVTGSINGAAETSAYVGPQQFLLTVEKQLAENEARIVIKAASPESLDSIKSSIRHLFAMRFRNAQYSFSTPTSPFEKLFGNQQAPLVAELEPKKGTLDANREQLIHLTTRLNQDSLLRSRNQLTFNNHLQLTIRVGEALRYDVSTGELHRLLKNLFQGQVVGLLHLADESIPIVIAAMNSDVYSILKLTSIRNRENQNIPLHLLVQAVPVSTFRQITARNSTEHVALAFSPKSEEQEIFENRITTLVEQQGFFNVKFSGSLLSDLALLKSMGIILIIAVVLLYFILAAQFESLVQPLLVLIELPIDVAGALLLLYLTGESLNVMSAIGLVVMSGIIINDSILKIDKINQLRRAGYELSEAIRLGGERRIKAILLTALTSVLAMIPVLFDNDFGSELQRPFAIALIGGMIVGTFVSVYVLPIFYFHIYSNRNVSKNQDRL